jgi:hypothetical protein
MLILVFYQAVKLPPRASFHREVQWPVIALSCKQPYSVLTAVNWYSCLTLYNDLALLRFHYDDLRQKPKAVRWRYFTVSSKIYSSQYQIIQTCIESQCPTRVSARWITKETKFLRWMNRKLDRHNKNETVMIEILKWNSYGFFSNLSVNWLFRINSVEFFLSNIRKYQSLLMKGRSVRIAQGRKIWKCRHTSICCRNPYNADTLQSVNLLQTFL